jgi:hypothetical protein
MRGELAGKRPPPRGPRPSFFHNLHPTQYAPNYRGCRTSRLERIKSGKFSRAAAAADFPPAADSELGLLINFGGELLKGSIQRLVDELDELTL